MSKKVICDICGEEGKIYLDGSDYFTRVGYYDLCQDCFKILIEETRKNVSDGIEVKTNDTKEDLYKLFDLVESHYPRFLIETEDTKKIELLNLVNFLHSKLSKRW